MAVRAHQGSTEIVAQVDRIRIELQRPLEGGDRTGGIERAGQRVGPHARDKGGFRRQDRRGFQQVHGLGPPADAVEQQSARGQRGRGGCAFLFQPCQLRLRPSGGERRLRPMQGPGDGIRLEPRRLTECGLRRGGITGQHQGKTKRIPCLGPFGRRRASA